MWALFSKLKSWTIRFWQSFSAVGLLMGTLFFAVSLTPSLLPRTFIMQGTLSGVSLALGYAVGILGLWLWDYLEVPRLAPRVEKKAKVVSALIFAIIAAIFLRQTADWQNTVRTLMDLEPVASAHPTKIGLIALSVFTIVIALARLVDLIFRFVSEKLDHVVPRRISRVVSIVIVGTLVWSAIDGVIFQVGLRAADASFKALDKLVEADVDQPADPNKTGSAASRIKWKELGRRGRDYISKAPRRQEIETFTGRPAQEPMRVYVGLTTADTARQRARLALEELKRVGAFDRSVLIIVTPTGTGWVDPSGMDTIEYLHNGDVASVAVQYSYLPSWLSLLVEPGYGADAAIALFNEVYRHWSGLPPDRRPKLYLHGLSLGALSSELSGELIDIIGDPYHGALWAGPPFASRMWRSVSQDRHPDSPAWLPRFRDGSIIRFTSQTNALAIPGARWGRLRYVYLQYASDPIVFFRPESLYQQPDWMKQPRGPDVSSALQWYPIVTFLQLALDMAVATTTPIGYGHVYAPEHYIDAWVEVTAPDGWNEPDIERLKDHFRGRT